MDLSEKILATAAGIIAVFLTLIMIIATIHAVIQVKLDYKRLQRAEDIQISIVQ